ncbi:hypothetical protein ACEQ8H_001007 [Pleosporales sp. CAS-2024a]
MAEVVGIISGLITAVQALESFAHQTRKWKRLYDRLFDIREGIDVAELALASWKRKFQIEERHGHVYMEALFGKQGYERIRASLGSIGIVARVVREDINKMIGKALLGQKDRAGSSSGYDGDVDERLVQDCLKRIQQNTSWSQKFMLSVLGKADELEKRLEKLDRKVTVLERFSDLYLEREHPDIFAEIQRLGGRRVIIKVGDGGMDDVGKHLRNSMAARDDAQLLHKASGKGNRVHIRLSVPHIGERDFDFLLNVEGRTDEVVLRPVKIKAIHDSPRVKSDLEAVVPAMRSNPQKEHYVLPSAASQNGFRIRVPAAHVLTELEHKESLATMIQNRDRQLGSQILYQQDQSAIACGIAQGALRLIGSEWMGFLDCANIRWRRTKDGQWTSMLTATLGNASTTRALEQCCTANRMGRGSRDLTKHMHIFRIGLVLCELALKTPISYVDFDPSSNSVKLFINHDEEIDAVDLAAAVERENNVLLGNIVFYCLNVLQDKDRMRDRAIEADYFREVVKDAQELESALQTGGID